MNALDDTLYYALQGLETKLAMQYNCHLGWSCRHIVRTGIEVAQTMLGDEDVEEHKQSYYSLISRRMSSEPRETMMVFIVMQALFRLIENDSQAQRCRSTFANDWCDEVEDIYHSYLRAVDEQIDIELNKLPNHTFSVTVMRTEQPQTVINVAGNYIAEQHIDIHDNPYATIYATAQPAEQANENAPSSSATVSAEKALFCRITQAAYDRGVAQSVEDELSTASISAPKLVKAIRTNEALGYLETKSLSAVELYDLLNEHFHLTFKLRTFQTYRAK